MPEGVELSQEQFDLLEAHLAREAANQAQEDVEYFCANNIVPTEALVQEIAERRARLAWGKIEAELEERVSAGMSLDEALASYLATVENQESKVSETQGEDEVMANNGRFARFKQQFNQYHRSLENSPMLCIGIGLAVLFFGIIMTMIDIATTEALVLGTTDKITGVQWAILSQPYYLFTGTYDLRHTVAYGYAWTIETIQMVFGLVLGHALTKISSISPRLAKLFVIIGALLIILNGVATYNAAPSANPLMQVLVAVAVGGFSVICLPLGIGLIEVGVEEIF